MEYLIGSFITFVGVTIFYYVHQQIANKVKPVKLRASQSKTHDMFAPILLNIGDYRKKDTQAMNHFDSGRLKILFTDTDAYWIKDNAVFSAPIDPQTGQIIEDQQKEVDMMGMDKVQLNEMMFIVEKLTEGRTNDNWGTGN